MQLDYDYENFDHNKLPKVMIEKTKLANGIILEIEDFLNQDEIASLLATRISKFEGANEHYPEYYRNNSRLVEDNDELAATLNIRLDQYKVANQLEEQIYGINSRLRFCLYQKNEHFSPHQDGVYYTQNGLQSEYTFLLYLNDDFEGGSTTFYASRSDKYPAKTIVPKPGKLVIFNHHIWHAGTEVSLGDKYILRSDIFVKEKLEENHHKGYIWRLLPINESLFLSSSRDCTVKLWNSQLDTLKTYEFHHHSVLDMVMLNDKSILSSSRDFTLKRWNLEGTLITSILLDEMIIKLTVCNSHFIYAVGTSGLGYKFDKNLNLLQTIKLHDGWIWDITCTKDHVLTCGADGKLMQWNIQENTTVCVFNFKHGLFCMNIANHSIYLGSEEGTIIHLNENFEELSTKQVHSNIIRAIKLKNNALISCGEDCKIMATDEYLDHSEVVLETNNFVQDILFKENTINAAGYDGIIYQMEFPLLH